MDFADDGDLYAKIQKQKATGRNFTEAVCEVDNACHYTANTGLVCSNMLGN